MWPTVQRIRDLLRAVPQPDAVAKPPPLRVRLSSHLERELAQRRAACAQIHALVQGVRGGGPRGATVPQDRKGKGKARDQDERQQLPPWIERQVVHLVAQTMRLQLHLGDVSSAKELDRAFFSRAPHPSTKRALRLLRRGQRAQAKAHKALRLGDGLGLERGDALPAWMQSLAVRLRAGANPAVALERFLKLYGDFRRGKEAREQQSGMRVEGYRPPGGMRGEEEEHGRDSHRPGGSLVLAFLARRMGLLQYRVRGAASKLRPTRTRWVHHQLQAFMDELRAAEQDEGDVVALALLESSLERLEDASEPRAAHVDLDDPLYREVEAGVERLVASLGDVLDGAPPDAPTRALARRPGWMQLEHRAQVLHLAIRFLLVRARSHPSSPSPSTSSAPLAASPLASASQLYLLLLDLTPSASSHPLLALTALPRLRLRQSSALFRLVSAHLGALSASQHGPRRRDPLGASPAAAAGEHDDDDARLAPLSRLTALLSATLSTLSRLPPPPLPPPAAPRGTTPTPDPRRLNLSTHVLRAALLALGGAFDPSLPARRDAQPAFERVRGACEALLRCREWDAAFSLRAGGPHEAVGGEREREREEGQGEPQRGREGQPLLRREDAARALVRAALLSESRAGDAGPAGHAHPRGADVRARLEWLLDWVARLQRASPPPGASPAGAGTVERQARRSVARAVKVVVERAWGDGEGGREWREEVMRRVGEWVEEGEREWEGERGEGGARVESEGGE